MKKTNYNSPKVECIRICAEDILTTSPFIDQEHPDDLDIL